MLLVLSRNFEVFLKVMDTQQRLERLNAYLLSKGRKPKSATPVNFVKQNIAVACGNSSAIRRNSGKYVSARAKVSSRTISSSTMRKSSVVAPPANGNARRKNKENLHSVDKRKYEGKSVSKVQPKTTEKVTPRISHKVASSSLNKMKSAASAPRCKSMSRLKISGKSQSASANSTPLKCHQPILNSGERPKQYKKLNNWLISKGKTPFGVKAKIPGFKAVKTIQTPVGSPSSVPQSPSVQTPSRKSHWQGLRDEDDLDEIAVLIRNAMSDVRNCIKEGCPTSILEETLEELVENLPTVTQHAQYWIALALIQQAADADYSKICDIYEKAILAKAQPITDIQEALSEWLLKGVHGQKKTTAVDELENVSRSVPTNQSSIEHPALHKLKIATPPVYKNAATSPIIFKSPVRNRDASPSVPQSPSSVVKLRMVSKSSPVFNRIKSLRSLPDSASAVITPVRRSTRIATAQHNYPIGLRDHEPCLSSVQEIFPALGYDTSNSNDDALSCDVVFDPNNALNQDNDIAKVLNF